MKNLGKIILVLFVLEQFVYAGVVASVDFNKVTIGETVTYSIKSTNATIERPQIDTICDTNVMSTASQTNIEVINGNYTRTKIFTYQFMPPKTCTIQSFSFHVDGKTEKTEPIKVEVLPAKKDVHADFVIDLLSKKSDVFVGEPFTIEMLIKQKHTARALDSKFVAPKMNGFWVSGQPQQSKYDDGTFMITKLTYRVSAQHAGDLEITPAQLAVAKRSNIRDSWGSFMQDVVWKSYYSNGLKIHAKAIPEGAKYIGNFTISAQVDKKEVNSNEAVNVTVSIKGDGNLEDIEPFKPSIADVSVFDEKPTINTNEFREKIALVGDNDFVVPAFSLTFYNPQTKKKETIQTQAISIKVHGSKAKQTMEIQRSPSQTSQVVKTTLVHDTQALALWKIVLIFLSGVLLGGVGVYLKPWEKFKREKTVDIKDEKKLLIKLLPFKEDADVKIVTDILEHNIYFKEKKVIDKKLLKELLRRYDMH